MVMAISIKSHGKYSIPGSGNSDSNVSSNNKVLQHGHFSRGELPFSR